MNNVKRDRDNHSFRNLTLEHALNIYKTESDMSLILEYFSHILPQTLKPPIVSILAAKLSFGNHLPIMALSHDVIQTGAAIVDLKIIDEYQQRIYATLGFHEPPFVVKTITVSVEYQKRKRFLLLTGLDDWKVSIQLKERLSEITDLPKNALNHKFRINDPEFDPLVNLGLAPGYVGPFPYFIKNLDYLIFLNNNEKKTRLVAVRLTPFDMLIFAEELFQ